MARPALLVVTGPPCAGKTTLARALCARLGWPLFAKDELKETLFAALGWGDRAWSRRLSGAAFALQFRLADELLAAGRPCALEGNFRAEHADAARELLARHPEVRAAQVLVAAAPELLVARFRARAGTRHPGHCDEASAAELEATLRAPPPPPLPLPGPCARRDTSTAWPALEPLLAELGLAPREA